MSYQIAPVLSEDWGDVREALKHQAGSLEPYFTGYREAVTMANRLRRAGLVVVIRHGSGCDVHTEGLVPVPRRAS